MGTTLILVGCFFNFTNLYLILIYLTRSYENAPMSTTNGYQVVLSWGYIWRRLQQSSVLNPQHSLFFCLTQYLLKAKLLVLSNDFSTKKFHVCCYGKLKKVMDLHMDGCSDVIESICLKPTCLISCKLQGNPMIHHQSQQAPKGVSH
jgi:hypothetical protein